MHQRMIYYDAITLDVRACTNGLTDCANDVQQLDSKFKLWIIMCQYDTRANTNREKSLTDETEVCVLEARSTFGTFLFPAMLLQQTCI